MTHPRAGNLEEEYQADRDQEIEKVRKETLALRERQTQWGEVAADPNSTTDALRRVITDEALTWKQAQGILQGVSEFSSILAGICLWRQDFQRAAAAHPNLPPMLFGQELDINRHTVAGLLGNPVLPLMLLEYPDFVERLGAESQGKFAQHVLLHQDVPPALLGVLAMMSDPWLALEARTHIAAAESDAPATAELEWLDAQIVSLLRTDTMSLRCLVHELAAHGFLSREIEPLPPWLASAMSVPENIASHPTVIALLRELNSFTGQNAKERETSLLVWVETMLTREENRAKAPFLEAALSHPGTPGWVSKTITKGWPWGRMHCYAWSLHRLLTLRQGSATSGVITQFRNEALNEALESGNRSFGPYRSSPGIFYFVGRDLPDILQAARLDSIKYTLLGQDDLPENTQNISFLVRLVIALRLNSATIDQQEWREILRSDPNRFVRAAACRHLVWPKPVSWYRD